MTTRCLPAIAMILSIASPQFARAVSPNADELAEARRWAAVKFEGVEDTKPAEAGRQAYDVGPFCSFTYDGKPSAELLKTWDCKRSSQQLDAQHTEHTIAYTDRASGLQLRCVGIEYHDFPTVEWTLYFKNAGDKDTAILEKIQALDIQLERPAGKAPDQHEFLLHHNIGSHCKADDYQPLETILAAGTTKHIAPAGGRGTNEVFSSCNLEIPAGGGLILSVGWPGQWAADFIRDRENHLRIRAGMELTHFKLLPGEEIRSPLIVLQFWKGDIVRSQNIWRRWMMAHSMPRPNDKLPPPQLAASSSGAYNEMVKADEQSQIMWIDRYCEEGIKLDYWWMDAGWYVNDGKWSTVGTWEVDPKRFPRGLRPVSDHAHAKGIKIIVWFEPERVSPHTWLADNHPEWILYPFKDGKPDRTRTGILNLGNPDVWNWLVNHIDKIITEQGIDLYRQDFNTDPLESWRRNDAEDRQGITEIKHITGYLAYWDELRRRHPNMLIDTCASGGRRNDVETLRRAVPLWRSDYAYEPIGQQCMTYGLSSWIPYHGTGTVAYIKANYYNTGRLPVEPYAFWSNCAPALGLGIDVRVKDNDYAAWRRLIDQRSKIAPYYYGDFYPLVPYSLDKSAWIGWQFDCPELGEGMVQLFRRAESPYELGRFKLRGLEADAVYTLTNLDVPGATEKSGRQLMNDGLPIELREQPSALVLTYKRKP